MEKVYTLRVNLDNGTSCSEYNMKEIDIETFFDTIANCMDNYIRAKRGVITSLIVARHKISSVQIFEHLNIPSVY